MCTLQDHWLTLAKGMIGELKTPNAPKIASDWGRKPTSRPSGLRYENDHHHMHDQVTKQWLMRGFHSFSASARRRVWVSMAIVSSASNLLAQLDEEDEALRLIALQSLNNVVHEFWFQIASSIASVEAFYEDESFTHRELAALVASKVRS